ncbi:LOW QUALITY PROTEIN: maestro heat-like repeat family member 5 [Suricata suricatta]|uniref:LOW QUALITY PROTEIN: maestro heat-like repeat family member 5 n=1 Tax=Suricata suricatta TaxID=37032 RepID=UPI001155EFA0|nr:LOW QUALITY PROTEIN: maestro heat-like repeat family member 5 [Suricata suricatta]
MSFHASRSMKVLQDPDHRDRQKTHPTTIILFRPQSSQAAMRPKEHKTFMEEAYSADIRQTCPAGSPPTVGRTISRVWASGRALKRASTWMDKAKACPRAHSPPWPPAPQELEEAYQDAAADVLLAVCRHSWWVVAQHLEAEVLTGVFPHRSLLYVMGIMTSNESVIHQGEKACWEEQLAKMAVKSVQFLNKDVWSKELLLALTKPDQTHQEQPPEKAFLFMYYGLILQAEDNATTIRAHLRTLLGTSHEWPKQREDETLKQSFLAAVLTLVGAISRSEEAHGYKFSQISELLECLVGLMEKEPQNALCTSTRQQTIHIISSLCKLRPPLDLERKSRLLSVCLRSVLALPLLDVLEKHTCLFLEPPNIQTLYNETSEALDQMLQSFITQTPTAEELHFLLSHMHVWLASEKAHERQRAAHSCMALLGFLSHNLILDTKEGFLRIGQLVGMLGLLCQDPDKSTQHSSLEGLAHIYQLLMRQRAREVLKVEMRTPKQLSQASEDGDPVCSSRDQKTAPPTRWEMAFPKDHIFQEVMENLTAAELTDLIWTAVTGLGSTSPSGVQAAAHMLLIAVQEHGAKLETVTNLGQAIHLQLCSIHISRAKDLALHAFTLLARNHTPELVATLLDSSMPLDSHALRLWRALGAERPVSRLVVATLLAWLRERPLPPGAGDGSPPPKEKAHLRTLAAMNLLKELQSAHEFKKAVQEAYPELLLALLTQMYYVLELHLPEGPQRTATSSPQSTSLEALKSLLSSTGHWWDFAHMELQDAWKLFASTRTYPQGVRLLARAMVQIPCGHIKAVMGQLLAALQSEEEGERKAAILVLTEFLYSPELLEVLPRQATRIVLARSLGDPSPEVRVLSLKGLGNILFHPEKGSLLRGQLPAFLNGLFQSSEQVAVQLMGTVSDVLHRLGTNGMATQSLQVAVSARSFFDDERDGMRAAAMVLFGNLVAALTDKELSGLRTQVHQSLVPLLLHLQDRCPAVVAQAKFALYRCSVLLRWRPRHTLFCALAWERGLSARHFLWSCLVTHSQQEFSIHVAQALIYLHSRHHHIKTWAVLFIGYTICYHPQAVSQMMNSANTSLLLCTFEDFKKDPEPSIREFATKQLSFLREVVAAKPK